MSYADEPIHGTITTCLKVNLKKVQINLKTLSVNQPPSHAGAAVVHMVCLNQG